MGERSGISDDELQVAWKKLPEDDQRFISALSFVTEIIGDPALDYTKPPSWIESGLRRADQNMHFSIITECVYLMLDAAALKDAKGRYRKRRNRPSVRRLIRAATPARNRSSKRKEQTS